MKTLAKAVLGALALATVAAAAAPADAQIVIRRPVVTIMREPSVCLRPRAFRPAFCFQRNMRWRSAYWRGLRPSQRMVFLQRRRWGFG